MISIVKYFSTFLFFVVSQVNSVEEVDYRCELKWVPEGYGNIPKAAVVPAPGEFIARVNRLEDNEWVTGRVVPEEGKAFVVFIVEDGKHDVFSSATYEVLTNPDNCLVDWVPAFGGDVPKYAIPGDEKTKSGFVGRGMVAGFAMAGYILPAGSALLVPYEGKVYPRRQYDVLISQYPKLNMELSNFIFPILDFRVLEKNSKETLIGQMELTSDVKEGIKQEINVVQPISHSKKVKEVFKWEEKQGWEGVANLTIDMDLWVGSPSIAVLFINVDKEQPKKLLFKRDRSITVDRTVTISGKGEGKETDSNNYQVCSSVSMLNNFGVNFEALATVTAPLMNSNQLKEILRRTGRNILGEVEDLEEDGMVLAKIYGTLKGTFVTGTASYFQPVDQFGPCISVVKRSKHNKATHFHGH